MWLLLSHDVRRSVEAAADNPSLARLSSVNPKLVSTFVWTVAGFVSTIVDDPAARRSDGGVGGLDNLGPITLSRAMIAFVLAGMRSYPRAVCRGRRCSGSARRSCASTSSASLACSTWSGSCWCWSVIYVQSRSKTDDGVFAFAPKVRKRPERVNEVVWLRHAPKIAGVLIVVAVLALARDRHAAESPARVRQRRLLRDLRHVAARSSPDGPGSCRLAQMTFAGLRRAVRSGVRARVRARRVDHRLSGAVAAVPRGDPARRAHRRRDGRRDRARARSACAGCGWRSRRSCSRSRRSSTSTSARCSATAHTSSVTFRPRHAVRPRRSTVTARTTTSASPCSSSCSCSSADFAAAVSGARRSPCATTPTPRPATRSRRHAPS